MMFSAFYRLSFRRKGYGAVQTKQVEYMYSFGMRRSRGYIYIPFLRISRGEDTVDVTPVVHGSEYLVSAEINGSTYRWRLPYGYLYPLPVELRRVVIEADKWLRKHHAELTLSDRKQQKNDLTNFTA